MGWHHTYMLHNVAPGQTHHLHVRVQLLIIKLNNSRQPKHLHNKTNYFTHTILIHHNGTTVTDLFVVFLDF